VVWKKFVGDRITDPEETMYSAREWQQDLRTFLAKEAPKERRLMYLVTVPKLNNVPETSKYFFYNTHWFVVQVIVPEDYDVSKDIDYVDKMKLHKFRIYAGFARHYRSIDYLHEWPQNANIPPNHRLKIARNNWAGVDISFDKFMDEFLEKSQQFMDEVRRIAVAQL
jgi:predicted P-loop ATPase/GTPase